MYIGCSMWAAGDTRRAWDVEGAGGATGSTFGVQCETGCLQSPKCGGLAAALSDVLQCMLVVLITRLRWFPQPHAFVAHLRRFPQQLAFMGRPGRFTWCLNGLMALQDGFLSRSYLWPVQGGFPGA